MYHPMSDPSGTPPTIFALDPPVAALNRPTLTGEQEADLIVVGGGIAGCSAALRAAEQGASVVLLEANSIGWGASGRNAGHVAPASKLRFDEALAMYGPVHGARFNQASETGPDLVFGLTERYGFDADVQRSGIMIAAHSPAALADLEAKAAAMQKLGRPITMLGRDQAARAIGSELYLGAYRDARGGSINPLAYARGLAVAAEGLGARIFETSPATGMAPSGDGWRVETPSGAVRGRNVILCTNAYTGALWPGLDKSIVPARSYHFATAPLPPDMAAKILPGGEVMTDTFRFLIGLRMSKDRRLHFNGNGPIVGPDRGPDVAASLARIQQIYPQLAGIPLDLAWSGWMAMNNANTWQTHRLAPGVFAMLGCNGRGVAMASFLGRDLAEAALGKAESDMIIPFSPLKKMRFHAFHALGANIIAAHWRRKDRRALKQLYAGR